MLRWPCGFPCAELQLSVGFGWFLSCRIPLEAGLFGLVDVFLLLAKICRNHRLSVLITEFHETCVGIKPGITYKETRLTWGQLTTKVKHVFIALCARLEFDMFAVESLTIPVSTHTWLTLNLHQWDLWVYSYGDTSTVSQSQKTCVEVGLVLFFHAGTQCLISTGADIRFGFGRGEILHVQYIWAADMSTSHAICLSSLPS